MGDRRADRHPLAWQGTLAQMKAHGTLVAQTSDCGCVGSWRALDVDELLAAHGPAYMLWDRRPACVRCGKPGHYMASPAEGTPMRPLQTSLHNKVLHREFLRSFGFTRRDVLRIKAMAEATSASAIPRALNDLDVPFRVGAVMPEDVRHSSGQVLGEWSGRTLLWWAMHDAERAVWARRPKGPRRV